MVKGNGYLKREEVPEYLQSNPRFKKLIEEGEKILNGSYNVSDTSKVQTFSENGVSIDDKVINSNTNEKPLPKKDYNNIPNKKIKDVFASQKNYKEVINEGLQKGGLIDKLRKLYNTPLASEESIRQWFEHGMSNKNASEKMILYAELKEDIYKEGMEKDWDIKKYNQELNRMQKRLFPEIDFPEIE